MYSLVAIAKPRRLTPLHPVGVCVQARRVRARERGRHLGEDHGSVCVCVYVRHLGEDHGADFLAF